MRAALAPMGADVGGSRVRVLGELVDRATSPRRFPAMLLAGFALFALLLASLSVYAVPHCHTRARVDCTLRMIDALRRQLNRRLTIHGQVLA